MTFQTALGFYAMGTDGIPVPSAVGHINNAVFQAVQCLSEQTVELGIRFPIKVGDYDVHLYSSIIEIGLVCTALLRYDDYHSFIGNPFGCQRLLTINLTFYKVPLESPLQSHKSKPVVNDVPGIDFGYHNISSSSFFKYCMPESTTSYPFDDTFEA